MKNKINLFHRSTRNNSIEYSVFCIGSVEQALDYNTTKRFTMNYAQKACPYENHIEETLLALARLNMDKCKPILASSTKKVEAE